MTAYNCKIGHALPSSPHNLCSDTSNIQDMIRNHPEDWGHYRETVGDSRYLPCDSTCRFFSNQVAVNHWKERVGFD